MQEEDGDDGLVMVGTAVLQVAGSTSFNSRKPGEVVP
jgi:hypothetical protein